MARAFVPGSRHWPLAVLLGLLEPALACLGDTFGLVTPAGRHRHPEDAQNRLIRA
jgi:hypothetical protein